MLFIILNRSFVPGSYRLRHSFTQGAAPSCRLLARSNEWSKVMLKNWIAASAFATAFCLMAGMPNAQAMPMGNAGNGDAQVILVSGGCGPYWHRGPDGGVSPIFGPYGGRWCPPGFHLGPYRGRCWPN